MHYRIRGDSVQLVKTVLDGDKKKSTPVGSVNLNTRAITLKDEKALTDGERKEVEEWVERKVSLRARKEELVVFTLPEAMQEATRWLKANDSPEAEHLKAEIRYAWPFLRQVVGTD